MDKEISRILEELMLNIPSYGYQIDGKLVLSFLIEWKNKFEHSHISSNQKKIFLKDLDALSTKIRKTIDDPITEYLLCGDGWVTFGEGWQPTTTIEDLIHCLSQYQNPSPSGSDLSKIMGDNIMV